MSQLKKVLLRSILMNEINIVTREQLFKILGLLDAIQFPLNDASNGYYDLLEHIQKEYVLLLNMLIEYKDE